MSLAKNRAIQAATAAVEPKKLSQIKDKDERRFRIEDAVGTMKNFARVKREVRTIKQDKQLFEAAKAVLTQEMADTKKAMTS
ncbi:hypothetical protein KAR91_44995 [Candidatus Pacearchaeota archaeon]|nr:hypothetical protein [Candidatus Pacearchaeota archaeon]